MFAVIVVIARTESKSEKIIVNQHRSHIDVMKVLDNFMVSFTPKNLTSSLTLESDIVKCRAESYKNIFERVSNHKKVRQPLQRQNQRKNKSGE